MSDSPYLLLLETSAILGNNINTWQAIAKLGECLLSSVVAMEIKDIAEGREEGNESAARQFQNLLPQLNWLVTPLTTKHPKLILNSSQNLSRKAKLILQVAQSAVGVANAHPQKCVVLISDEILLRDQIAQLECQNLCAIPSAIARLWARTEQAPPIVEQLVQRQSVQQQDIIGLQIVNSQSQVISPKKNINEKADLASRQKSQPFLKRITTTLIKLAITTIFGVVGLWLGWQLVKNQQFQQFWKKTGLPPLPKILIEPNQNPQKINNKT